MRTRHARRIRSGVERARHEALFGLGVGLAPLEVIERHSRWVMPDRLSQTAYLHAMDRMLPSLTRVHRARREPVLHRRTWRGMAA